MGTNTFVGASDFSDVTNPKQFYKILIGNLLKEPEFRRFYFEILASFDFSLRFSFVQDFA